MRFAALYRASTRARGPVAASGGGRVRAFQAAGACKTLAALRCAPGALSCFEAR